MQSYEKHHLEECYEEPQANQCIFSFLIAGSLLLGNSPRISAVEDTFTCYGGCRCTDQCHGRDESPALLRTEHKLGYEPIHAA